ncbi:MAG TPA: DNA mismatch repair endonuclease MutL [Thermodesulfobacteriaceae bacterium]|nr:DNA mismatch repair endonuclease MutL [Thermodesulfobacteriaceae bacterium]
MSRIRILPEEVSRRIAAGEVIERPASVVKELVENALDAGARKIRVELERGGTLLVRVKDDGEGMSPEDLRLCWRSHATSKISSVEDLFRITTYGFRGEALFSIAQVSRLTIVSRPRGAEHGFQLEVAFGKEEAFRASPSGYGTVVEVKDLFSEFPARKSFLKGPRAEAGRALEVLKMLALGRPEVSYTFFHEGREIFSFAGGSRRALLSKMLKISEEVLLEKTYKRKAYRLELILTKPSSGLATSRYLFVLVNDRVVKDRRLVSALLEGLRDYFPGGRYPAGLLALYLPPHLVDVNVHPAKWEIRFREEQEVYGLVRWAAERALANRLVVPVTTSSEEDLPLPSKDVLPAERPSSQPIESLFSKPAIRELQEVYPVKEAAEDRPRFLGFLRNTYLLFETGDGLLLLDFHAAHERLIYEELKRNLDKGACGRESLLFPVVFELSEEAREKLLRERALFERLGFGLRESGPREVLVEEVPAGFGPEAVEELRGILEEEFRAPEKWREEILSRLACRRARKAGERFSPEEAQELLARILREGFVRCPHGRPLYLIFSWHELEKRFGRKP